MRVVERTVQSLIANGFVFEVDVLACACGGRIRLIAVIEASETTVRILRHLGLPEAVPTPRPSRAPPLDDWAA
jgi:hypothetical protein